jgi:hypothetical protein
MEVIKMKRILLCTLVFLCLVTLRTAHADSHDINMALKTVTGCSSEDNKYSLELAGIEADKARDFGLKIQKSVRDKNLESLFALVNGELSNGPRKAFIKNKKFDEIFPMDWQTAVLDSIPDCNPVGWRGFMLGPGYVWYQFNKDGRGEIFSINGAKEEIPEESIHSEWHYKGKTINKNCFTTIWLSGDNYEHFHEEFAEDVDYSTFFRFIGLYIGKQISIEPIANPWTDIGLTEPLSLTAKIPDCLHADDIEQTYKILKDIPKSYCKSLAPNFPQGCEDVRLVKVTGDCGGSMGCKVDTVIYGIVNDPETAESYVVPLVNFDSENDALNFIEELRE